MQFLIWWKSRAIYKWNKNDNYPALVWIDPVWLCARPPSVPIVLLCKTDRLCGESEIPRLWDVHFLFTCGEAAQVNRWYIFLNLSFLLWIELVQGCSYSFGQRFCVCFALKSALQRGEGRKGRECKFQNKAQRYLDIINPLTPVLKILNIGGFFEPPQYVQTS